MLVWVEMEWVVQRASMGLTLLGGAEGLGVVVGLDEDHTIN
jgi:hypothetical protein